MEKPFNPRTSGQPFVKSTIQSNIKYINRVNLPEKKIDENLIARLFLLVDEGNVTKIKDYILQNNFLINVRNEINGENILHTVIKSGNLSNDDKTYLVKLFLLKGVSAIAFDKFNVTPLHLAVKNQLKDIVELLIKYGADVNSLDSNNMNSVHYAVIGKNVKCPNEVESSTFIIPKKQKEKTPEEIILQDLFNNINTLFFSNDKTKTIFKNIYNNINNYDELYKNELEAKKTELEKKVGEILINKDESIEKKSELIKDELNKISDDLKGLFMNEYDSDNVDLTKYFNYDTTNNKIIFNTELLDLDVIEKKLYDNFSKTLIDINSTTDELLKSYNDISGNLINIKMDLMNIRWLNRTLVINYSWDGVVDILDRQGNIIRPVNIRRIDDEVPVCEIFLNNIYELKPDKKDINNLNLIIPDTVQTNLETNYNNFDLDFDIRYSDNANKYKRVSVSTEKPTTAENILGYDINTANETTEARLTDRLHTFAFPFVFQIKSTDTSPNTIPDSVKRSFIKRVNVFAILLNEQLSIIKHNFGVINEYMKYMEGWNIMIHIIPTIVLCIFNSIRLLKAINDELVEINSKFKEIEELFVNKQRENSTKRIGHFWIYEKAIIATKKCQEESEKIKNNTFRQYNILLKLIDKYNIILDKIKDLQGFRHIKEYHFNYNLNDVNNVINMDDEFLNDEYSLNTRIFTKNFDDFKLNFSKYKKLDLIENTRAFFETNYLNKLFNSNNNFYVDGDRRDIINDELRDKFNYKYPNNDDIIAFNNERNFMSFNPYNTLNFNQYNFSNIEFNAGKNSRKKEESNADIIKNVIGNHYLIQKFMLTHYISNIFTPNDKLYNNLKKLIEDFDSGKLYYKIQQNLEDYKNLYLTKMKIEESEFQNKQFSLLVDVLGESYDNYIDFLIKQKSKQLAFNLFKSYKSRDPLYNQIIIGGTEVFPIIKSDTQFKDLGLSTKLSLEEIKNIESYDYDFFIDNDLLKESIEIKFYKTDENTCFQLNTDIIEYLIDKKVNLAQKDNSGRMPISYALEFKNLDLINILSKSSGIQFYKNNKDIINYFNILIKNSINELVTFESYNDFYEKYEHKLIKKLEAKEEINTNILSSIEYTVPMYLSLLNSMLFNVILNYGYGYTQNDLDKLINILNPILSINKELYYGPILYQIYYECNPENRGKHISLDLLEKEIHKIEAKLELQKRAKKIVEDVKATPIINENKFDEINKNQLDANDNDLTTSIAYLQDKKTSLESINIRDPTPELDRNKIKFTQQSVKNISSMYNHIFKNILNEISTTGYTSSIEIKNYKELWRKYYKQDEGDIQQNQYISNIHLMALNYIDKNINTEHLNKNIDIFIKLFGVFNNVAKDYHESPFEFNKTNYHLEESIKLIIHTITHTVINYLYTTIIKMIIKQLEESYDLTKHISRKDYQDHIVLLLEKILNNNNGKSQLIKYLFEDMPEKLVKTILGIYDTDADPDSKKSLDSIFNEIITIIKKSSTTIINTDENSKLINDLKSYIIPYYKEYSKIITFELFELTNKFFKHLSGMYNLLEIYKKLN